MNSVVRSWHSRQAVTVAPGSPWQNCFSERLIGTIRRECLDRRAGEREYLGRYIRPKRDDTLPATFFWRLPKALNYIGFRDLSAGRAELDMEPLVWTRSKGFPLFRLESRLCCPMCGSREVVLMFVLPSERQSVSARRR
jgi:hypothetical protein